VSLRLRRLKADYDQICTVFGNHPKIRIAGTIGTPPEKYQVEFLVSSLQMNPADNQVRLHNQFVAEIVLTGAYPRLAPQCRFLTPVFHPNIAPHAVCIGDHWAAGESLAHLIVRIAEMLAFQSYNVKSPLNGEAARWVEMNRGSLPLDGTDFAAFLAVGQAVRRTADGDLVAGGECANCGKHEAPENMTVCVNQHVACRDCVMNCSSCGRVLCLKCDLAVCAVCGRSVCQHCIRKCAGCGRLACRDHAATCVTCNIWHCSDCVVKCAVCGAQVCVSHVVGAEVDGVDTHICPACSERALSAQAAGQ
jgi:ubiquitin-protein ligase